MVFPQDLLAHYGCVNAVEFSHDGDLMVSGGDDKRVLLWSLDRAITSRSGEYQPVVMRGQHESNIFCLDFDWDSSKLYSGGNDASVLVHDVTTTQTVEFFRHEEPVYGLSVCPVNSNVFLSACSDGRVLQYDLRQRPEEEPLLLAGYSHAFHAAQYNPCEPRLVVTSNQKMGLGLWDVRKPGSLVLGYGGVGGVSQTSMYVRWNCRGDRILGLRRRLSPVLYRVDSPAAIAQFDHPGYYNSCTMKSCCFGGQEDEFVLSGSDDFNLYMWRVPEEGESRSQWVVRAHHVLQGHRSIVNQVRYNKSRALLASSGVEKVVKLWSGLPLPLSPGDSSQQINTEAERRVYSHEEYIGLVLREGSMISHDYSSESTKENPRMMAFFDSLVQREIEGWNTTDAETEESDSEYSNTLEDGDESDTVTYTRRERSGEESEIQSSSTSASSSFISSSSYNSRQDSVMEREGTPSQQEAETQTPPQSSQNLIAELIAKKRVQLMRKSKKKEEDEKEDPGEVSRILESARRALRSDSSGSSTVSSQEENLPGTSSGSVILRRLRRKRAKLMADRSDTESESEEDIQETEEGSAVNFRKQTKNIKRYLREKSKDDSD